MVPEPEETDEMVDKMVIDWYAHCVINKLKFRYRSDMSDLLFGGMSALSRGFGVNLSGLQLCSAFSIMSSVLFLEVKFIFRVTSMRNAMCILRTNQEHQP